MPGTGRGGFWWLCGAAASLFVFFVFARSVPGFAIPVGILGVIGATAIVVLLGPIGRAIARRLEGQSAAPPDELIAELENLRTRVLELEERVDFSERLLAQHRSSSPVERA